MRQLHVWFDDEQAEEPVIIDGDDYEQARHFNPDKPVYILNGRGAATLLNGWMRDEGQAVRAWTDISDASNVFVVASYFDDEISFAFWHEAYDGYSTDDFEWFMTFGEVDDA